MDVSVREDSSALDEHRKDLLDDCSVCSTPLHQSRLPQLFPCLHSTCSTCLSKQQKQESKKSMECPSCKRLFGITEIMDNAIFNLPPPSPGKGVIKKCGGCEGLVISGWCMECGEFLCPDCVSAHNRVKLTRNHTVVAQELSTGPHPTLYCQSHSGQSLKFFCMDCDMLACRSCLSGDHRNHRYQMLRAAVSASREKLHSLEGAVTKQKDQVKQSLLDVDQRLQNIIDLKAKLRNALCWKVFKVYQIMLRKASRLFQYAMGVYGTEEEQLSQQKASLERMEERQNYVMSFIKKTLSTEGHAVALLRNRIESQINDLLGQSVPPAQCMVEVKLQVDATVMNKVDNFGRISVKLVPFAQDQTDQSKSALESIPKLQNVPNDCIDKGTSLTSPDSSTSGPLLSRSPLVPNGDHSQSHKHPIGLLQPMPSSSHTFQCNSSRTQNVPKDCIINAATSTTSSDQTSTQTAPHSQSPTISSSDAVQSQAKSSGGLQPCQARPNEFFSRLRDVMRVSVPNTNHVKTKDKHRVQVVTIDLTCDDDISTAEAKNSTPPKKSIRHQVDLESSTHLGLPHPWCKVNQNGFQDIIPPNKIKEEHLVEDQSTDSRNSAPLLPDASESRVCCKVCDLEEGTLFCAECGRCFHRRCHVPPITTQFILHKWKCSLCQDFSNPIDPFNRDRPRKLCLSSLDQRRCEYLILALMCKKNSCILYLSNKKAAPLPVDFDFIHERLLRKRSPPYRTPSELVSDVWVLLESLQSRSESLEDVLKMQRSFEKRVNQVFGDVLHPSLLTRPTMKAGGQIKRETLKRENSSEDYTGPVVKKPHLD